MNEFFVKLLLLYMLIGQFVLIFHLFKLYKKENDKNLFWAMALGGGIIMVSFYAVLWPICTVKD